MKWSSAWGISFRNHEGDTACDMHKVELQRCIRNAYQPAPECYIFMQQDRSGVGRGPESLTAIYAARCVHFFRFVQRATDHRPAARSVGRSPVYGGRLRDVGDNRALCDSGRVCVAFTGAHRWPTDWSFDRVQVWRPTSTQNWSFLRRSSDPVSVRMKSTPLITARARDLSVTTRAVNSPVSSQPNDVSPLVRVPTKTNHSFRSYVLPPFLPSFLPYFGVLFDPRVRPALYATPSLRYTV